MRTLLAFLLTISAQAAPTIVGSAVNHFNTGGSSLSDTRTSTLGNVLIVYGQVNNANTMTVTDTNGDTFNLLPTHPLNVAGSNFYVWWAKVLTSGSNTVTVTLNSAQSFWGMNVSEWSGVPNTGPFDTGAQNIADVGAGPGTNASSGNFTTTAAGDLLIAWGLQASSGTGLTCAGGWTTGFADNGFVFCYQLAGAAGTYAGHAIASNFNNIQVLGVGFLAAAAATAVPFVLNNPVTMP
jgi:hypothetical protein